MNVLVFLYIKKNVSLMSQVILRQPYSKDMHFDIKRKTRLIFKAFSSNNFDTYLLIERLAMCLSQFNDSLISV